MNSQLRKASIERYSRQIVLKDIGTIGQKKIISAKVLIVGMGGLGSPVAEFLARAGVGSIGIVDDDKVSLSNLHRQSLYNTSDIGKFKVQVARVKIKKINPIIKIKTYKIRLIKTNFKKIINRKIFKTNSTKRYWHYRAKKNYICKSFNCWNGWLRVSCC